MNEIKEKDPSLQDYKISKLKSKLIALLIGIVIIAGVIWVGYLLIQACGCNTPIK